MRAEIYQRIADVPADVWDGVLGDGTQAMTRSFWALLERSGLNDFDYRYALFFDDAGRVVGITSFYTVTTDIAIFAPTTLRKFLEIVRRVWPGFLKLRMLECGTPITITSPPFICRASVAEDDMVRAIAELLRATARAEGQAFIVVRDFEPNAVGLERAFRLQGYHWVDSLPNTHLEIRWRTPREYLDSMRSYYRSKLQKHSRRNLDAGVRHELVEDVEPLAEKLCAQWMVVHEHASEFQREVLTTEFYRRFCRELAPNAKALMFYRQDALAGHALLLRDGDMLRWLYVGRATAANDGLYLYVAQKVVETAITLGAKRLEMGLTTYAVKQDLGAEVTPIKIAVRASWGVINPFVGLGYWVLNRVPRHSGRPVFKSMS